MNEKIIDIIKNTIASFFSLYKHIFYLFMLNEKKKKVLFFFNNTNHGGGSISGLYPKIFRIFVDYFNKDKILNTYFMVEPNYSNSVKGKYNNAIKFDFFFNIILILRKIIPNTIFKSDISRELFIGRVISILSLKAFNYDLIITIQNTGGAYLKGICNDSIIIDYQHGMFHPRINEYINEDGALSEYFTLNNKYLFLWGGGFLDFFNDLWPNLDRPSNLVIFGYPKNYSDMPVKPFFNSKKIFITLQYVNDTNLSSVDKHIDYNSLNNLYEQILDATENFPDFEFILKHHPKSEVKKEIIKIFKKNRNVTFHNSDDKNIEVFLHLSYFSSCIFEFSLNKIPTQIISNSTVADYVMHEFKFYENKNLVINEYIELYKSNKQEWLSLITNNKKWAKNYLEDIDYSVMDKYLKI